MKQPWLERRDLGDHTPLDAKDVELEGAKLGVTWPAKIARGGRHPIGLRRHEAPIAFASSPINHRRDLVHALEEERMWRHRDSQVLGRDRHRRRSITPLLRIDETLKRL